LAMRPAAGWRSASRWKPWAQRWGTSSVAGDNPRRSTAARKLTLEVVICTYNHARDLDLVLAALEAQRVADHVDWSILVVDNASTDDTAEVAGRHGAAGSGPTQRYVFEPEQGLTPARRRGVRESAADWIAFVDDDNILDPDWIAEVAAVIEQRPDAAGVGGRVLLDFAEPPPFYLRDFGFCFAAQDHGPEARQVRNLVGAGLALNRQVLVDTGWLERPLLDDRIGERLVSGGDVEIAQRIRASGGALWFTPAAMLRHKIPSSRTTRGYFLRINASLGFSGALVSAITWPGDYQSWRRRAWSNWRRKAAWGASQFAAGLFRRRNFTAGLGWCAFAWGLWRGLVAVECMTSGCRTALLGAAAPRSDGR
jgi:glucosyl-dolichyl phosphate glucuronosyltransferase